MKDSSTLGLAGKFRINNLVRPCAQIARYFDTAENIGASTPMVGLECALSNDKRTRLHGFKRISDSSRVYADAINYSEEKSLRFQMGEIALLVLNAALNKSFRYRV